MTKAKEMHLFTNRNCLIFDDDGKQICEYQSKISCLHIDKKFARKIINESEMFYLSKFREWSHEISREEMEYLLGVHNTQLVNDDSVCYNCHFNVDNKCMNTRTNFIQTENKKTDHVCVVCGSSDECLYYNGCD